MTSTEEKMINRNIGQLIITFAFFYSSVICHFKALEFYNDQSLGLAIFLWICATSSFLGALRFQIAKVIYKILDLMKNGK